VTTGTEAHDVYMSWFAISLNIFCQSQTGISLNRNETKKATTLTRHTD